MAKIAVVARETRRIIKFVERNVTNRYALIGGNLLFVYTSYYPKYNIFEWEKNLDSFSGFYVYHPVIDH